MSCPVCGGPIPRTNTTYCSRRCRHLGDFPTRPCEVCEKPHRNARFCSETCRNLAHRRRETRDCPNCGQEFEVFRSHSKKFCSLSCSASGSNNPNYNGGFSKAGNRTIVCTRDGGYVFWYRIVMEDAIGRPLVPEEIVHHTNGDPTDDRLENLQIVTREAHIDMHRDGLKAAT